MVMTEVIWLYVLQGKYAAGWEDIDASYDLPEIRMNHKAYIQNEGGTYRVVRRKEMVVE